MSPIASMRAESFATREPSPRPVVPASPVRVTIFERRWPMLLSREVAGQHTRTGDEGQATRGCEPEGARPQYHGSLS